MTRPGSTDLATDSKQRPKPSSGSESRNDPPQRPVRTPLKQRQHRRNIIIVIASANGASHRFIANVFDLHPSRIARILKEHRTRYSARPESPPPSPTGPILAPRDDEPPAHLKAARRCPVKLRGEGRPILVYGQKVPGMSGVAYSVLAIIVEGFRKDIGYQPWELKEVTTSKRPLRMFNQAIRRPEFEPLRRVIPAWNARKGKTLEIVDIGPPC